MFSCRLVASSNNDTPTGYFRGGADGPGAQASRLIAAGCRGRWSRAGRVQAEAAQLEGGEFRHDPLVSGAPRLRRVVVEAAQRGHGRGGQGAQREQAGPGLAGKPGELPGLAGLPDPAEPDGQPGAERDRDRQHRDSHRGEQGEFRRGLLESCSGGAEVVPGRFQPGQGRGQVVADERHVPRCFGCAGHVAGEAVARVVEEDAGAGERRQGPVQRDRSPHSERDPGEREQVAAELQGTAQGTVSVDRHGAPREQRSGGVGSIQVCPASTVGVPPARRSQSGVPGIPPHTVNDLQNVAWWACMPERTG